MTRDQRRGRIAQTCGWKSNGQRVCDEPATGDGLCLRHSLKRADRTRTDLQPRSKSRTVTYEREWGYHDQETETEIFRILSEAPRAIVDQWYCKKGIAWWTGVPGEQMRLIRDEIDAIGTVRVRRIKE